MGQGGYVTLINGTPYDWTKTHEHSYQMNSWNFPDVVPAWRSVRVYVEWDGNVFHTTSDDAAETNYTIAECGQVFQIAASAKNGFDIRIVYLSLSTQGRPPGSSIDLGWNHDGDVNFVLSGPSDSFVDNAPPVAWMQANRSWLGSLTLRQLCMPGSHDAGMSVYTSGTAFASKCNTLTQTRSIGGQLAAGSRYFDVRPVISAGDFLTGHYSKVTQIDSWQGANGQSIASIIDDVNNFLASNGEFVVIRLSHDLNTDVGNSSYRPFTQGEWNDLFKVLTGVAKRWTLLDPTDVDLSSMRLDALIGSGQGAVIFIVDPSDPAVTLGGYAGQGFFSPRNYPIYDDYAHKNEVSAMAADQLAKMRAQRLTPNSPSFLLSWTLTQSDTQASTCATGLASSILDLAAQADPALPGMLWPACQPVPHPSILYIDAVADPVVAGLALAVNRLAQKSVPTPSGSGYVPSGSYGLSSRNVRITVTADCVALSGARSRSSISYAANALAGVSDLANMNADLAFVREDGQVLSTPEWSGSAFIPCGTYLRTSNLVSVAIEAECRDHAGVWRPASLTFTKDQALGWGDIANSDGALVGVPE